MVLKLTDPVVLQQALSEAKQLSAQDLKSSLGSEAPFVTNVQVLDTSSLGDNAVGLAVSLDLSAFINQLAGAFGAEVIHPKTMQPARSAGIPIRIKNTFRPEAPGTLITARPSPGGSRLLVSGINGMALLTIEGTGILGQPGMILRLLTPIALAGTNIYMVSMSSSEYNISFAIMESDVEKTMKSLERDLRERGILGDQVARITVERGMSAVAVVGAGMKGQRGIAGRIFSALGDRGVNVVAIAQGSSEYNITIVVKSRDMRAAVAAIHGRVNRGR